MSCVSDAIFRYSSTETILIGGRYGYGKTFTLSHILNYAYNDGFLIVNAGAGEFLSLCSFHPCAHAASVRVSNASCLV